MSEPMYSCDGHVNGFVCAEEITYPKDMLREHEHKNYCENCWVESGDFREGQWSDLSPFIPEHEKEIDRLEKRAAELEKALEWYGEKAEYIAKHYDAGEERVVACVVALKLDAGNRAKAYSTPTGEEEK